MEQTVILTEEQWKALEAFLHETMLDCYHIRSKKILYLTLEPIYNALRQQTRSSKNNPPSKIERVKPQEIM